MPGRESMSAQESAWTPSRTKASREAAEVGIADISAGRYRDFRAPGELTQHLRVLLERIISARRAIR